jgi:hypothetical protein
MWLLLDPMWSLAPRFLVSPQVELFTHEYGLSNFFLVDLTSLNQPMALYEREFMVSSPMV